jgi:hypothetical protein
MSTNADQIPGNRINGPSRDLIEYQAATGLSVLLEDNRHESLMQRKLQGIADLSHQVQQTSRTTQIMNGSPDNGSAGVIQRTSINRIKSTLVSKSVSRDSNQAYLRILVNLDEAGNLEIEGVKSAKSGELIQLLQDIISLIPAARSTHRKQTTRNARNTALNNLDLSLTEKINMLRRTANARKLNDDEKLNIGSGPKAGFEVEFNNVILFNIDQLSDVQAGLLSKVDNSSELNQLWFDNARFAKREVLFTAPNGTWEGTADSTLKLCSNLEVVTKPLTPEQWLEDKGAAEQDQAAFLTLVQAINDASSLEILFPAELHPDIRLNHPGVRLLKLDHTLTPQSQMTAAVRVEKNTGAIPDWWIKGLNWNAIPYLIQLREGLETTNFRGQDNPKSGAFIKNELNVILKTPVLQLLGVPDDEVQSQAVQTWVNNLSRILGVDPGQVVGENGIVAASNILKRKKKNFHLSPTGFTWGRYLSALVTEDQDLVTQWAKTAFVVGGEDIGLGQLGDESLGQDYVIEEHRQFSGENTPAYLPFARSWATTGEVK